MHIPKQLVVALAAFLPGDFISQQKVWREGQVTSITNTASTKSGDLQPSLSPAIVLWHGLGDHYNSDGMQHAAELIAQLMPETFVHSVYIDEDPSLDERKSLFGNASAQVDLVCESLAKIPQLANGFNAIGFSQGGLFLRALIHRCPHISVSTLATFGSPHMGVLEISVCEPKDDWICQKRNQLLKRQVWQDSVQKTIVPAQYFRDMAQYDQYLAHSTFLADVNNERESPNNIAARQRFEKLDKLILVQFDQDTTLVPKESAFFQERHALTGQVVPITQTSAFMNNLFGLKTLYEQQKIEYYTLDSNHMQFTDEFLTEIISRHFAGQLLYAHQPE